MSKLAAIALVVALVQSGAAQQAPQRLCGRVDSVTCAGPSSSITLTVHVDKERQFKVLIRPEHRQAFGPDIYTRYPERRICVIPRAIADTAAVVESPLDLEITAEPKPPIPPLPAGVHNSCDSALKHPEVIKEVKPDFRGVLPGISRAAVTMRVVVNADGTTGQIVVLKSVPSMDRAAVDAARQWRFRPAQLEGSPVASVVHVEISFSRR